MDIKKAGIKYLLLLMTGMIIMLFSFAEVYAEDTENSRINAADLSASAEREGMSAALSTKDEAESGTGIAADPAAYEAVDIAADMDESGAAGISEEIDEEKDTETDTEDCSEGHLWGEWEIVKEATYHKKGIRKHCCLRCGTEETEKTAKLKGKNKWVFENDKWYYLGGNGKFVKNKWKKLRLYGEKNESVRWCLFSSSGFLKKDISRDTENKWVKAGSRRYENLVQPPGNC